MPSARTVRMRAQRCRSHDAHHVPELVRLGGKVRLAVHLPLQDTGETEVKIDARHFTIMARVTRMQSQQMRDGLSPPQWLLHQAPALCR